MSSSSLTGPSDPGFAAALDLVFKHEGYYSNDKRDHGGETSFGISIRYLQTIGAIDPADGYLLGDMDHDGDIDHSDIALMDREEAAKIYESQWWERYGYGRIANLPIAAKVFDLAINCGPKRAHMMLQEAVNKVTQLPGGPLVVDGSLGSKTLTTIMGCTSKPLIYAELKLRAIAYYASLKQVAFIFGWIARALDDIKQG